MAGVLGLALASGPYRGAYRWCAGSSGAHGGAASHTPRPLHHTTASVTPHHRVRYTTPHHNTPPVPWSVPVVCWTCAILHGIADLFTFLFYVCDAIWLCDYVCETAPSKDQRSDAAAPEPNSDGCSSQTGSGTIHHYWVQVHCRCCPDCLATRIPTDSDAF